MKKSFFVLLTLTCFSSQGNVNAALIFKSKSSVHEIKSCLLKHTFYNPETKTCEVPLDDYNCPRGQWMVPDKNSLGEVYCEDVKEDEECLMGMDVIGNTRTIECLDKHMKKLMGRFQTSECQNGQILLPTNFEENTNPCPDKFICSDKKDYSQHLPGHGEIEKVNFLKSLICHQKPNKICLPSKIRGNSLWTPENLISSFVTADLECRENPCQEGFWPWIDESDDEGIQRCLPIDDECKTGEIPILKEPGENRLSCSVVVQFSVTGV